MPTVSKKQKKALADDRKRRKKSKEAAEAAIASATIPNDEDLPVDPFTAEDPEEFEDGESPSAVSFTPPVPFSDGIVHVALKDALAIPRRGGMDVDLLRGFLGYFSTYGTFVGNIFSKVSFMKKQGGRLI